MRGLDPRIHDEEQRGKLYRLRLSRVIMDCRVKPGNDNGEGEPAMTAERAVQVRPLLNPRNFRKLSRCSIL